MENLDNIKNRSQNHTPAFGEVDFDGYSAAPLLLAGAEKKQWLIDRQDKLYAGFFNAVDYEYNPSNWDTVDLNNFPTKNVIDFVKHAIYIRMQQREGLNSREYINRLNKRPNLKVAPGVTKSEIIKASINALYGRGTVMQNDLARRAFGMASIEYANLTSIGNFRKELEPPMWEEVGNLVGKNAEPKFDDMNNFQIMQFDRNIYDSKHIGAMRIGMKREIGELDDGTIVKARSTTIINMRHSSDIDQNIVLKIRDTMIAAEFASKINDDRSADLINVPEFNNMMKWIVENNYPSKYVLAKNETIYGYNPQTAKAVQQQIEARRRY